MTNFFRLFGIVDKDLEAANARLILLQTEHDALHLARISNPPAEIVESPLEEYCRLKKQKQIESHNVNIFVTSLLFAISFRSLTSTCIGRTFRS